MVLKVPDNKVTLDYEGGYVVLLVEGKTRQELANLLLGAVAE